MTTLAVYSNKGGVGKTATAVNLAYLAARSGKSTLICDLDAQGATTFYLRVKPKVKRAARGFVKAGKEIEESIKSTDYVNIFNAADCLLVPLIPTTLSVRAYEQMLAFFRESDYPQRGVYVFCSMVDRRKKMHRETCDMVRNTLERVLHSAIPYLSEIEQMGIAREPVAAFAHKCAAARAYQDLWSEVQTII